MASHCHPHSHHPPHHHCPHPPPPSSSSCTCNCNAHLPLPYPPSPPPEQLTPQQLLQVLDFLLHQYQPHLKTNAFYRWDPEAIKEPNHHHFLVSSLDRRISDLESALGRFHPPRSTGRAQSCVSLREAAARIIQTRFRGFLVRRSRALGQLQELAYLKASFVSLKSSISGRTQFDSEVVSRKAMDLLHRVNSIEGCDSMIRDGKRSITRDLVRFLEFVDGFALRRRVEKSRTVSVRHRNGKLGGNGSVSVEELRSRVERIRQLSRNFEDEENDVELEGFQQFIDHGAVDGRSEARKKILENKVGVRPRSTKSVRFAENGNVYRVFNDERKPVPNADTCHADGSDDNEEEGEKEFDIVEESRGTTGGEENDDEVQSESEGSSQSSDGQRIPKSNEALRGSGGAGSNRHFHDQDGDIVFSAPFSAKIHQRADLAKKRQGVQILR